MVSKVFLNRLLRRELSIKARMMGSGKPATRL